MEINNTFSFSRMGFLIKRHYVLNFKALLISFSAIGAFLAVVGALSSWSGNSFNHQVFVSLFYVMLFFGGYILTSSIFSELHTPERSIHFLTLPASNFEKLFNAWLNTTIFYIGIATICFYVSYLFSSIMAFWWFDAPLEGLNLFNVGFLKILKVYLVTQSVFFFGAIYFKGYNLLKVILSLFVLSLIHSLYQTLFGAVAFREIFLLAIHGGNMEEMISAPGLEDYVTNTLLPMGKVIFYFVMPAFLLIMSYLRIREREV